MEPSDLELWQSAAKGDARSFHVLVDRHTPGMMRIALGLSRTRSDAEDVCQETFIAAYKSLKTFDGRASVKTWLTRILMRRAAKLWNKQKHDRKTFPIHKNDNSGDSDSMMGHEQSAGFVTPSNTTAIDQRLDLMEVIQTLPEEFRETIILREVDGLSYQEIADVLEVPRGTVESRIFRARAELRKKLSGYG